MASNLLLIIVLVLVSLSLTSGYSHFTRDVIFKQDDESYFRATNDQGSVMIDVEDLAKARSLQALVSGSKVAVNKAGSKGSSTKSSKTKVHKSKGGSLNVPALVGIIIVAIVVTIVIICVIYYFYLRHKTKKALSIGEEKKINGSSETHTSKTEDIV